MRAKSEIWRGHGAANPAIWGAAPLMNSQGRFACHPAGPLPYVVRPSAHARKRGDVAERLKATVC